MLNNRLIVSVVVIHIVVLILSSPTVYAQETGTISAQISGKITNTKTDLEKHLWPNPYLMLVHDSEEIGLGIAGHGGFIILPAEEISQKLPESGVFTFNSDKLNPGKYYIYVQSTRDFTINMGGHQLSISFLVKENTKDRLAINISQPSNQETLIVDLGNVKILTP